MYNNYTSLIVNIIFPLILLGIANMVAWQSSKHCFKDSHPALTQILIPHGECAYGIEPWGFPVVRLGSTRLPVMVYK